MTPPGLWSYIADWNGREVFTILVEKKEPEDGWNDVRWTIKSFKEGYYDMETNGEPETLNKLYIPLGAL